MDFDTISQHLSLDNLKNNDSGHEFFIRLFNNIKDCVFFVTELRPDHKVLFVNTFYEELWGNSVQSLYDNPRSWLDNIVTEDRKKITNAFQHQLMTSLHFDEQYRIQRKDGTIRWVHDKTYLITSKQDASAFIIGFAKDITQEKIPNRKLSLLSPREVEVLKLIALGERPVDIAQKLQLNIRTISTYRSRLLQKLKLKNNSDLVKFVIDHNL